MIGKNFVVISMYSLFEGFKSSCIVTRFYY